IDQIPREILRFGDDAPAFDRVVYSGERAVLESRQRDRLNLLVLFLRAVFVGFEIGNENTFGNGLRSGRAAFALACEKDEILHPAGFQMTQRGAGNLAEVADREFPRLPCPDEKKSLRVHPFGKMQEYGFERLARDFAARDESCETARHAAVDFGENAVKFVIAFKNICDEG